jgi:hypothetical protein
MAAQKGNQYAKGNPGGCGGKTKYRPEYVSITRNLCARGLTDAEIADVLEVAETTLHAWKLKHEEFAEALRRTKGEANAIVEASLYKRANCFHYETERVTHGRKVVVKEYALPDVGAQRLWLQNRMPEVYREQKEVKHQLSMDDAFLKFLDKMDERAKLERARNARLIEHQPISDTQSLDQSLVVLEIQAVPVDEQLAVSGQI